MQKIDLTKTFKKDAATVVQLEGNHNVTAVAVTLASASSGVLTVK